MVGGGLLRMAQEGGIDAGIAEGQGFPVHPHWPVLQWAHQFLGGVHQLEEVAAMPPALALGGGDEHLQGGIAGAGAHAGQGGIHPAGAGLHRHYGVGDAQGQVVVGVDSPFGLRLQRLVVGFEAFAVAVHVQRAAGIGDIDALGAIGLHQPRLLRQGLWFAHVGHHQEAHCVHAEFAGDFNMLAGDICLGAVGGDARRADAGVPGALQLVAGGDARQDEGGDHRLLHHFRHCRYPLPICVGAEAVVEAAAVQAVAMGDFYRVHAGFVQRAGDFPHLVYAVQVADGVHAVAQGDVLDVQALLGGVGDFAVLGSHAAAPYLSWAMRWPVARAAEVMMSRLPA